MSHKQLPTLKAHKDMPNQPAGPGPVGYRFEHRIHIQARPQEVWVILSDISNWGNWATLYPRSSGQLTPGGQFQVTLKVPGTPGFTSTSSQVTFEENRFLSYEPSTMFPSFMMSTLRYIQIEEQPDGTSIVCNGEVLYKPVGSLFARLMQNNLMKGLTAMNQGLKTQAEKLTSKKGR